MTALTVLMVSTVTFAAAIALRHRGMRICAICAAISLTWLGLLALRITGRDVDPLLIAVLMGQSVTGLMYLAERHLAEQWHVFRLAFVLTLTFLTYSLLGAAGSRTLLPYVWIATLWLLSIIAYALRSHGKWKLIAEKVIACCRDW